LRTLETIQADIEYVAKKKGNAFTRLFTDNTERLEFLRKEEFKFLDQHLLKTNSEYEKLAQANMKLIEGLTWELKVLDLTHDRGGITKELSGEITNKGILYCHRIPTYSLLSKSILRYSGTIDHYGNLFVTAEGSEHSILYSPQTYVGQIKNGNLIIDRKEEEFGITHDTQVVKMVGDIFQSSNAKRLEFLTNRKKLYEILNQNRIKV
jgi:BMFP domain-containing protein YqiC